MTTSSSDDSRGPISRAATPASETLALFIDAVEDYAIFMLDPGGHVASWNTGAQKIKGYRPDEILGRHFSVFYPSDALAAGVPERQLQLARLNGRVEHEGWRVRKDGTRFHANVVITAVHDATGKLVGFAKVTRDMSEHLRIADLERSRALAAQAQIAREDEQRRIARELHDDLGQQLVALKMDVGLLQEALVSAQCGSAGLDRTRRLQTTIDHLLGSVRRIAADLRPPLLDDLGLAAAIEWIANDFEQRHGMVARLHLDPLALEFTGPGASSVFRIVQEALTNVVRHAQASRVSIDAALSDEHLLLIIADNGVGTLIDAPRDRESYGLLGMSERVHLLGGTIAFDSAPSHGFRITIRLPLANLQG